MPTDRQGSGWNSFRRVFFHEDLPSPDVQDVLMASNVLEIPEFEVFRLSYAYWYGTLPTDAQIEPSYVSYMFDAKVPSFVRQFTRRVRSMQTQGTIDRDELGVRDRTTTMRNIRLGLLVFVLLFAIQVLVYAMAAYTAGQTPLLVGSCFLPPCY